MMDCKNLQFVWLSVIMSLYVFNVESVNKKVVIHIPYKVKKVNHVHTIFKTIHHHHTHREPHTEFSLSPTEEHEHFHHLHIHDNVPFGQHNQQIHDIGIPEFLSDDALDAPLKIPDIPHEVPRLPVRNSIPLYRRQYKTT